MNRDDMIAKAKDWYLKRYPRRWTVHREDLDMADFAAEQIKIAVQSERKRIAVELRAMLCNIHSIPTAMDLIQYTERLEVKTDD